MRLDDVLRCRVEMNEQRAGGVLDLCGKCVQEIDATGARVEPESDEQQHSCDRCGFLGEPGEMVARLRRQREANGEAIEARRMEAEADHLAPKLRRSHVRSKQPF